MSWKTTLVLIALTLGGGYAWYRTEDRAREAAPESPSAAVLDALAAPGALSAITVRTGRGESVTLTRSPGGWALPGNWPVRPAEAARLADTVARLRSRFEPVALSADADLSVYGLADAQKPLAVSATAGTATHVLRFGRPDVGGNPFARPTYMRVGDAPEVLRLGPDVLAALDRPADAYRARQLFPGFRRLRLTGLTASAPEPSPGAPPAAPPAPSAFSEARTLAADDVSAVRLVDAGLVIDLTRVGPTPKPEAKAGDADPAVPAAELARAWRLDAPIRDRADPDGLVGVLEAVPDLWAERFVEPAEVAKPDFRAKSGLDSPTRQIRVTAGGVSRTLRIGARSREEVRREPGGTPEFPGMEAPPGREVREPFYYAQIDSSPEVFEVRGARFGTLFVAASRLRDSAIARVNAERVQTLTLAAPVRPPLTLRRVPGDKDSPLPEKRIDRWSAESGGATVPAEISRVTDVFAKLNGVKLPPRDMLDPPAPSPGLGLVAGGAAADPLIPLGLRPETAVRVTLEEGGRTLSLSVGTPDAVTKKVPVTVDGWPRVNLVPGDVREAIDRPALAFRSRKVFDVSGDARVSTVSVQQAGDAFELKSDPADGGKWLLTAPVQATAELLKAGQLASDLELLNAGEYVQENPAPADLARYGLDKPAVTVRVTIGKEPSARTLAVGKPVGGKEESYARLDGGPVFTLAKASVDSLSAKSLTYRQSTPWPALGELASLSVQRPKSARYTLEQKAARWELTAPFPAPTGQEPAEALAKAAREARAERWEAHAPADLKPYGLDDAAQPLRLTLAGPAAPAGDKPATPVTLLVGSPVAPGQGARFARLETPAVPGVFVVPEAFAKEIDRDVLEMLDRQLLNLDRGDVSAIRVASGAGEVALKLDGARWVPAAGPAFAVDQPTVANLLVAASRLSAARFAAFGDRIDEAAFGLEPAAKPATLTLTVGGRERVVTLGKPLPGGERFARVDGLAGVAVLSPETAAALPADRLALAERGVFSFDSVELLELTRTAGGETLTLANDAAQWKLTAPAPATADAGLMDELAESLSRLRAERVVELSVTDKKKFGLDPPAAVVKLTVGEKTRTLTVGAPAEANRPGRYAQADGSPAVVLLPPLLSKRLTAPALAFRDRTLATVVSADRIETVDGDRQRTFVQKDGRWSMTAPVAAEADDAALRGAFEALARLRADEVVALKPAADALKSFGLEKPAAVWKLFSGDKAVLALQVGSKEPNGERVYARVEGSDIVALLDLSTSAKVTGEYRARALWPAMDVTRAETLTISRAGENVVLRKTPAGWTDQAAPGTPIDSAAVAETLDALASLRAERFADDAATPDERKLFGLDPARPEGLIVLTTPDGSRTLRLGRMEGTSKRVYAQADGADAVAVLGERETAALTRTRAGYAGKR